MELDYIGYRCLLLLVFIPELFARFPAKREIISKQDELVRYSELFGSLTRRV